MTKQLPKTLLVELRCEELPPALLFRLAHDLSCILAGQLQRAGFLATKHDYQQAHEDFSGGHKRDDYNERMKREWGIENYATPRRIAMLFKNVRPKTKVASITKRGPALGGHPQAKTGFLNSNNASSNDLSEIKYKGTRYHALVIESPVINLTEVLGELIEKTIKNVSAPRMMRWGENDWQFVRPIKDWCIVHGNKAVRTKIFGIPSSGITVGHRFLSPGKKSISGKLEGARDYVDKLKKKQVLVDPIERQKRIFRQIERIENDHGRIKVKHDDLDDDNVKMCEWPTPYLVEFDRKFLELPARVVEICVQKHLRSYMVTSDQNQDLEPYVVFVADNEFKLPIDKGKRNNSPHQLGVRRVIQARLDDSLFSYKKDCKLTINDMKRNLDGITYIQNFGTLTQRSERIMKLAEFIAKELELSDKEVLVNAAKYCQYDLGTQLHNEYPELEGLIAAELLTQRNVIDKKCARIIANRKQAVRPANDNSNILRYVDEVERLSAFALRKKLPRGSGDPHGLRQSAVRILQIINIHPAPLSLSVFREAILSLCRQDDQLELTVSDKKLVFKELLEFVLNRSHHMLVSTAGKDYSHISQRHCKAVISVSKQILSDYLEDPQSTDTRFLWSSLERIKALADLEKNSNDIYQGILRLHKRLDNIVNEVSYEVDYNHNDLNCNVINSVSELASFLYETEEMDSVRLNKLLINTYKSLELAVNRHLEDKRINVENVELHLHRLYPLYIARKVFNDFANFRQLYS